MILVPRRYARVARALEIAARFHCSKVYKLFVKYHRGIVSCFYDDTVMGFMEFVF